MLHIVTATIGAALALAATTGSVGAQQDFPKLKFLKIKEQPH